MTERMERTELSVGKERCFLVGVVSPDRAAAGEDPLEELAALVDTAGGEEAGRLVQKRDRPHPKTYLGKGRFEELVRAVQETEADTVAVDDDISPGQLAAIEAACRRKVIDRSEVILDIFAARARTHQAKLQVELAQSQYELPRLARKWTHLERLGGGIGTRGPGESQIETDRRLLRRRIASLRRELDRIEERKAREVRSRADCLTACLVGYTNAGKSTLLNRLTGADALVENRLFATLDTLTRKVELEDGTPVLLSDTVGFIRRLPHHLVASFHATLEEAAQADVLLHVADASSPLVLRQVEAVNATLRALGMADGDRLYVFNKIDADPDPSLLAALRESHAPSCAVSARTGEGIDALLAALSERARTGRRTETLRFDARDGRRLALLNEVGQVHEIAYEGEEAVVRVSLLPADLERIRRLRP